MAPRGTSGLRQGSRRDREGERPHLHGNAGGQKIKAGVDMGRRQPSTRWVQTTGKEGTVVVPGSVPGRGLRDA